mmetsp:Transcript_18843/g.39397  ORF Transcript_18843/g.39397 Transcript_18843/m.39397 type:complete len:511 (-) Transcript_18843:99-1631(-)
MTTTITITTPQTPPDSSSNRLGSDFFPLSATATKKTTASSLFSTARDLGSVHQKQTQQCHNIVVVLGGSGFIGRRVCRELVVSSKKDFLNRDADDDSTVTRKGITKVISVSRSGKPPSYYLDDDYGDSGGWCWSDHVEWIQHDIVVGNANDNSELLEKLRGVIQDISSSSNEDKDAGTKAIVDATIVGCIGDVNPSQTWMDLWGLGFDNDRLFRDNGRVYQQFLNETLLPLQRCESNNNNDSNDDNDDDDSQSLSNLRVRRFVLLSLDYVSQKCLEGPLDGYVDGKRLAEHEFLGALSSSKEETTRRRLDDVIVIGLPSFVYGGKRFPRSGAVYRKLVESAPAKAYVKSNKALRSLSMSATEDWVEEMIFSSPIHVDAVGGITAMAAKGLVTKDIVNDGQPRKQGFFNTSGLPVEYDDILFVDGTHEIEKMFGGGVHRQQFLQQYPPSSSPSSRRGIQLKHQQSSPSSSPPLWEGALIGKRPYLYPFPVALFFATFFWAVVTEQFVKTPI